MGLDDDTIKKLTGIIKASGAGIQIADNVIRRNIGANAMSILNKAIAAVDAGSSEDSKEDSKDSSEKDDSQKEQVKETFTFGKFLINEAMVDVDLSDPAQATASIRKMSRLAKDPARLARTQVNQAKQDRQEASEEEGPTKTIKMQIARKKQELAMLNKRLQDMQKQNMQQQEK